MFKFQSLFLFKIYLIYWTLSLNYHVTKVLFFVKFEQENKRLVSEMNSLVDEVR